LRADGVLFVGPEEGEMAERGEAGLGRLAEPATILAAIERHFAPAVRPLSGLKAVVTSGPTHEPIDPVRYLANRSSGRQGHAIAAALAAVGADVTLISGPVGIPPPAGVRIVEVETARQMDAAVEAALPLDIAVMAAAVADWRTASAEAEKIKKDGSGPPNLPLVENPDILAGLARHPNRPKLLVGFAAETEDVIGNARDKLERKACDWIVANDVSPGTGIMGGERNRVHLVTREGIEDWPDMSKTEVAARLVARIARHFARGAAVAAQEAARESDGAAPKPEHPRSPGPTSEPASRHEGTLDIRPTR
jgi:phosphopantothenoylcysteine decarboxylase / phosphopantothenate---cysteine ligase